MNTRTLDISTLCLRALKRSLPAAAGVGRLPPPLPPPPPPPPPWSAGLALGMPPADRGSVIVFRFRQVSSQPASQPASQHVAQVAEVEPHCCAVGVAVGACCPAAASKPPRRIRRARTTNKQINTQMSKQDNLVPPLGDCNRGKQQGEQSKRAGTAGGELNCVCMCEREGGEMVSKVRVGVGRVGGPTVTVMVCGFPAPH